jgi:AcrR family transcriptional regulator
MCRIEVLTPRSFMGFEYHNEIMIPYQRTGRVRQKARTNEALVAAARTLLSTGITPSVELAAEHAQVSRATAYRYFPTQHALLLAAYPEIGKTSVLGDEPPADLDARFEIVFAEMARQVTDNEAALRAMLRLSLEKPRQSHDLVLRRGRRITWLTDALAPLSSSMTAAAFEKLVLGIASCTGIESYIWLRDMAGCSQEEALEIMRFTAGTLLASSRPAVGTSR